MLMRRMAERLIVLAKRGERTARVASARREAGLSSRCLLSLSPLARACMRVGCFVLASLRTAVWPMAYGAPCGGNGRYARPAV
eukprot:2972256-Prymnesium_polylepis.1